MPVELHLFTTHGPRGTRQLLSLLGPDALADQPPPSAAVVGQWLGASQEEALSPQTLAPNAECAAFIQWVVSQHAPGMPEFQQQAAALGDGHVAVVDQRTRAGPFNVPPRDVLGSFEVRGGRVASYRPNPEHLLVSVDGLVELEAPLWAALLRELRTLVDPLG